jgi:hypothetical protein
MLSMSSATIIAYYLFYPGPWRKPQYYLTLPSPRKMPSIIFRLRRRAVEEPLSRVVSGSYRAPDLGGGDRQLRASVYQFCAERYTCKPQLEVSSFLFNRCGRKNRKSFIYFSSSLPSSELTVLITIVFEQKDIGVATMVKLESLVLLPFQFKVQQRQHRTGNGLRPKFLAALNI